MTVPAKVPSVFQSSRPLGDSYAEKNSSPPAAVSSLGKRTRGLSPLGRSRCVPAAVPSDFHNSSEPFSVAVKKSVDPTMVSSRGSLPPIPGSRSMTSTVPASVPSVRHNSRPASEVVAAK